LGSASANSGGASPLLSENGQERLNHAQREPIADDDAVDVAQVEMPGSCFDAQRASDLDPALPSQHSAPDKAGDGRR
jgi:hypothetical protein